jgi:hypothetical protein
MVAPGFLGFLRRLDPAEVVTPHVSMHATTKSPCSSAQVGPLQNADGLCGP